MKKPKIAIITLRNQYKYGGTHASQQAVFNFCKRYFEPTLFFLSFEKDISAHLRPFKTTSRNRAGMHNGMPCVEVGVRWAFWEPAHYAATREQWEEALQGYDYFFVVSGTPIAGHALALMNKRFVMWPASTYQHDREQRAQKMRSLRKWIDRLAQPWMLAIERLVLQKVAFVWPLSSYTHQLIKDVEPDFNQPYAICGFPIDYQPIIPLAPTNEKIIIAIGRFNDPRKNAPMLFRAFEKIYEQCADAQLFIIGSHPHPVDTLPFTGKKFFKNIVFTGELGRAKLLSFYQRATLMLISSYQEGLNIAGLEALAHGVPVISTDCGGIRDYVSNNKTGFVVACDDDTAMAEMACLLLKDQKKIAALKATIGTFMKNNFSVEQIHAIFRRGLLCAYPELKAWFERVEKVNHEDPRHQPHLCYTNQPR